MVQKLYEAMYVLDSSLTPEVGQQQMANVAEHTRQAGGDVRENFVIQKRQLSYEVDGHTEGVYALMYFMGDGAVVAELKHCFQVTPEVIRGLVVVANERAIWSEGQGGPGPAKPRPEAKAEAPAEEKAESVEAEAAEEAEAEAEAAPEAEAEAEQASDEPAEEATEEA
jgi:small subunit ribosomal protein S6